MRIWDFIHSQTTLVHSLLMVRPSFDRIFRLSVAARLSRSPHGARWRTRGRGLWSCARIDGWVLRAVADCCVRVRGIGECILSSVRWSRVPSRCGFSVICDSLISICKLAGYELRWQGNRQLSNCVVSVICCCLFGLIDRLIDWLVVMGVCMMGMAPRID